MVRSWFLTFAILLSSLILAYYDFLVLGIIIALSFLVYFVITSKPSYVIIMPIIFLMGLGYFNYSFSPLPIDLPIYNNYQFKGQVANYPIYDGERTSLVIKTKDEAKIIKKLQVYANFAVSLNKGDYVEISGKLSPPSSAGNPGEFNYQDYLAQEKIYYICHIKEPTDIKLLAKNRNYIFEVTNDYRSKIVSLSEIALGEEGASILLGMLLGKKENIAENQYEDFQRTGIVHVFAVSGLHVGFLIVFCHGITGLLALSSRGRFYVSLIALLFYGTLVGWPISVIRASIMAALAIFALYVSRERSLLDSLGLAGIALIFLDPYAPFKIAFQLSFAATWGLIYLYPLLRQSIEREGKLIDYILIPLAAQIPTIPFIAYHFNLFTPISVITNILLGYLIGIIVIAGFALITIAIFSPILFTILLMPIGALIKIVIGINNVLVNLPFAYIYVATPQPFLMGLYFLGLLGIILYFKIFKNSYLAISGFLLMVIFITFICLPASIYNRGQLEVIAIDVGQGDSILIKSPRGKFILIDGGGSEFSDVGKRKVLAYLHHRGIKQLYLAINSHPDTDHLQGMETVLDYIPTRYLAIPYTLQDDEQYLNLKNIAAKKNIPIMPLYKGHTLNIESDFSLEVIYPAKDNDLKSNENDQSLVLLGRYKDFSMLLTGDIEKLGLEKMLADYSLAPVTVLKIPHHGSKGSLVPTLYGDTRPSYGIISAGKNNVFGHPSTEVLEELAKVGTIPLRTDEGGLIQLITDGQKLTIKRPMLKKY